MKDVPGGLYIPCGNVIQNPASRNVTRLAEDAQHIILLFAVHEALSHEWRIAEYK
jgi:hypothetical protein